MQIVTLHLVFLLSSFLPCHRAYRPDGYIGCFLDWTNKILNGKYRKSNSNSGDECIEYCTLDGYRYAGTEKQISCRSEKANKEIADLVSIKMFTIDEPVHYFQATDECYCGNSIRRRKEIRGCTSVCPGNKEEICGGFWRISVYDTIKKTTTSSSSARATVPKTTSSTENNRVFTSTATTTNMAEVQYINSNAMNAYQTNMLAYIIVPVALVSAGVIVIVLVVVVVIKKRRQQRNGDDLYHIYCEPDVSGMTDASPQTTSQDTITKGKTKTANIQECQHKKQNVAGEESKSYMATSDMRTSGNTYANQEAINVKVMQSESYEMLQQNPGSGSEYTAIDMHGARHSGDRNYEVLNKDNVSEDDYLKLHFSM